MLNVIGKMNGTFGDNLFLVVDEHGFRVEKLDVIRRMLTPYGQEKVGCWHNPTDSAVYVPADKLFTKQGKLNKRYCNTQVILAMDSQTIGSFTVKINNKDLGQMNMLQISCVGEENVSEYYRYTRQYILVYLPKVNFFHSFYVDNTSELKMSKMFLQSTLCSNLFFFKLCGKAEKCGATHIDGDKYPLQHWIYAYEDSGKIQYPIDIKDSEYSISLFLDDLEKEGILNIPLLNLAPDVKGEKRENFIYAKDYEGYSHLKHFSIALFDALTRRFNSHPPKVYRESPWRTVDFKITPHGLLITEYDYNGSNRITGFLDFLNCRFNRFI